MSEIEAPIIDAGFVLTDAIRAKQVEGMPIAEGRALLQGLRDAIPCTSARHPLANRVFAMPTGSLASRTKPGSIGRVRRSAR